MKERTQEIGIGERERAMRRQIERGRKREECRRKRMRDKESKRKREWERRSCMKSQNGAGMTRVWHRRN